MNRGGEICPSVIVDIENVEKCLNNGKNKGAGSIYKVKESTCDNIYDPVVVSIGPYHHGKNTLRNMEKQKWNWMNYISKINTKRNLGDYVKALKKVECFARSYYTEEIKMESNEFINMLLLDGFSILSSFYSKEMAYDCQHSSNIAPEEGLHSQIDPLEYCFIMHDILLIENQIPYFVLNILYELFTSDESITPSLLDKVTHDLAEKILPPRYPKAIKESNAPRDFDHLLHLCHIYLRPNQNIHFYSMQLDSDDQTMDIWRGAMQYYTAGVKFQKREFHESNPHSLLDIRFTHNVLEIPCFIIDENTPSLFKNLIALEKTHAKFGNDIISYINFMSTLVCDPKDVTILVSKGIIEHDLRSEEAVVSLFKRLSEGIIFDCSRNFYLKHICHNLESYFENHMKWWNVLFRRITSPIRGRI